MVEGLNPNYKVLYLSLLSPGFRPGVIIMEKENLELVRICVLIVFNMGLGFLYNDARIFIWMIVGFLGNLALVYLTN